MSPVRRILLLPRAFLAARTNRERVLLGAFVWVVVILVASVLLRGARETVRDVGTTTRERAGQQVWLDAAPEIEAGLGEARERLDPERTFTAAQLIGRVDALARRVEGLQFSIATPTTRRGPIFHQHAVRIEIRRSSLDKLVDLAQAIQAESPYLGLERAQISANRNDPRLLDAVFEIGSFELVDDAL